MTVSPSRTENSCPDGSTRTRWLRLERSVRSAVSLMPRRAGQLRSRAVPRQPEDTLGDNVALDLLRTSGDVVGRRAEYMLRPPVSSPLPCVGCDARPEPPRRDVSCVGQASHPCELADG